MQPLRLSPLPHRCASNPKRFSCQDVTASCYKIFESTDLVWANQNIFCTSSNG
uniref:Uncharacterized protein n=1 Tax=Arundo donax TaxID=35708 RepID=A0A0A9FE12_ARUDO